MAGFRPFVLKNTHVYEVYLKYIYIYIYLFMSNSLPSYHLIHLESNFSLVRIVSYTILLGSINLDT